MTRPEKTTPIGESPAPHAEARRAFPAGLEQPEGSFRFSVDALKFKDIAGNDNVIDPNNDIHAALATGGVYAIGDGPQAAARGSSRLSPSKGNGSPCGI